MDQHDVVNFAVFTSIAVAFMQGGHPDDRIRAFETIAFACSLILRQLGRPSYISSIFKLWSGVTNSLVIFEVANFPDQAPQTTTNLNLPPRSRTLAALRDPDFLANLQMIRDAARALRDFVQWFETNYDIRLHSETMDMLADALLLFDGIADLMAIPRPQENPDDWPVISQEDIIDQHVLIEPSDPDAHPDDPVEVTIETSHAASSRGSN